MIGCDNCSEWFHGDCVGISKQVGSKVTQYMCIACAKRKENYNPEDPQAKWVSYDDEASTFDPTLYQHFA